MDVNQVIILGRECPECDQMEANVREALDRLGVTGAAIEHVDDIREQLEIFGVDKVPALVVDGTLVTQGEVPTVDEIVRMIEDEEYTE
jgi:small redox-active disulfide protein 2